MPREPGSAPDFTLRARDAALGWELNDLDDYSQACNLRVGRPETLAQSKKACDEMCVDDELLPSCNLPQ